MGSVQVNQHPFFLTRVRDADARLLKIRDSGGS